MLGRQAAPRLACVLAAVLLVAGPTLVHAQTGTGETPGVEDPPWRAWHSETLDRDFVSANTETAVGPDGDVWIAHDEQNGFPFELKHRDTQGWHNHDVPGGGIIPSDVAVDDRGRPWVVWAGAPGANFAVLNQSGDWWQLNAPEGQSRPEITFDDEGRLHLVAMRLLPDDPNPLKYGVFDPANPSQGWTIERIDEKVFRDMDIAVSPDGRVHVAWQHESGKTQYSVQTPSGGWETTQLRWCDWGENAIDVGPDGVVHLVCKDPSRGLIHHVNEDGSWSREVANDGSELVPPRFPSEIAEDSDLVVDAQGRPHVLYSTGFNSGNPDDPFQPELPIYTVKLADGWHRQAVDREGSQAGFATSLALDGGGRPQAAFARDAIVDRLGCSSRDVNCFSLRFAEPVIAQADWQTDRAGGVLGVGGAG